MVGAGAFWGTRVMEIVKKHDSGGLVWKRIKLTTTRKANAKKRLLRVWQNEAVLKACSQSQPSKMSAAGASGVDEKEGLNTAS
ncbi:hypothetical protein POPTR_001G325000v4 [Populus trichocarpa]|uniref:Uncharacterized protein n=2 Tax=Populus TaxID=3689 RepID=B9GF73_POPTR|nr:uncharacterized protein LOC7495811 [Populus trichocarpa]KAJ6949198.1 hypothetical protein NC651_003260 [Populus alba x Populus x berolinensis]KAI5604450.1 hypothetical protein BDE02_01G289400 [Populus trichocarpa]KAJ6965416.1 hypothetical protein NC652_003334 [Populus alba x Populus x berolinensis]KAJ7013748.1 hypothetical protein NC653_003404 [Populus alba x Populus x berolinensis]PNT57852.1 hypothetical protein POPTR_001G325000v4 [Populus trichocarpa]|eukprot:XP_002300133.1 uncharacterized protein LOC7495811 [Populus trichocarpa]